MRFKLVEELLEESPTAVLDKEELADIKLDQKFYTLLCEWLGIRHKESRADTKLKEVICSIVDFSLNPKEFCIHHINKDRKDYNYTNIAIIKIDSHNQFHTALRKLIGGSNSVFKQVYYEYIDGNMNCFEVINNTKESVAQIARDLLAEMKDAYILSNYIRK